MNSGQSSTKLNDMLIEFTNYVNDFYGDVDDVLYPMNHMETGKRVSKVDILGAIYDYLHEINTRNSEVFTWGDGDSLDRERVRDILVIRYGYDKTFAGTSLMNCSYNLFSSSYASFSLCSSSNNPLTFWST